MATAAAASYIYWLHLIILPLFVYIGVKKGSTPDILFNIVLGIAIIGIMYHVFKLISIYRPEHSKKISN